MHSRQQSAGMPGRCSDNKSFIVPIHSGSLQDYTRFEFDTGCEAGRRSDNIFSSQQNRGYVGNNDYVPKNKNRTFDISIATSSRVTPGNLFHNGGKQNLKAFLNQTGHVGGLNANIYINCKFNGPVCCTGNEPRKRKEKDIESEEE
ncbi:hypothetical protein O6P43_027996 [Quillaja saponaria]|uniref:Uncharacterized protein n=1 Tax=Quillaja saponaria TaxID=32244 RepID=A0AAD7L5M0_QUISA|nr:hypothetical protein O6P43_027996 [Quillaja saponaria]